MTEAILAIGTLLQMGDGATPTENFTTVSEVRSITGPGFKTDIKDVTNHSSPGRARERLGVLKDPGSLKFDINWQPQEPTHSFATGLLGHWANFDRTHYKLVLTDVGHTTWDFTAMVNDFSTSEKIDDVLMATIELTFVSIPTLA